MKELKLALLGFGNAGRAFGKLLLDKEEELALRYGVRVMVSAIVTKSKGTWIAPGGIDLRKAETELERFGHFSEGIALDALTVTREAEYDVLVELTPLEIFSGQPAISHIQTAFSRGKDVITANKGPVAWAFDDLREMAKERDCQFYYETTVMDGTPVFNLAEKTLKMCNVLAIQGILNSTTNFILEELGKGKPYPEIMEEGKRRGFVEADPSMDVDGWDAAAKVCALMNVLMNARITPPEVSREGIAGITYEQIKDAEKRGKVIKLLCSGRMEKGRAVAKVAPVEIEKTELLTTISGTDAAVSFTTDLMGTVTVVSHEPEIEQTAYGVFSDLLRVIENNCGNM